MTKIGLRVIKTAIGAAVSIILAQAMGLQYPYAAAIITILSIQDTKRKSIDVIIQRLKATALSLIIGSTMFLIFGFNAVAFGLYLLCFIPLTVKFNAAEGISTSAVLVTHLLGEKIISGELLLNEIGLMVIGTGVALIANLYMPKMMQRLSEDQDLIEEKFQTLISYLTSKIQRHPNPEINEGELFSSVKKLLEESKIRAERNQENYVLFQVSYFAQYMEMRFLQFEVLQKLAQIVEKVNLNLEEADILGNLTEQFILHLHDAKTIENLVAKTENVIEEFKNAPLPKTRDEFINQTLIFQYLNEFHHLLEINKTFEDNLRPEEKAFEEILIMRENISSAEKRALLKAIKRFKKNLRECYQKQLPFTDPKVQELVSIWKKFKNNKLLEEVQIVAKEIEHECSPYETGVFEYFQKAIKADNEAIKDLN